MKKIKKTGSIFIFAALLLNSCGNSGEDSTSPASTVNEISTKQKSDEKSTQSFSIDLSTPSKAIESFFQSGHPQLLLLLVQSIPSNPVQEPWCIQ
jgi:PBP1b-binding outer membrane lipoprotein LpoB